MLGDDSVSESAEAVHPSGSPINHSTHVGFSAPPTCVGRPSPDVGESPLRLWLPFMNAPFCPSLAIGVGHSPRRAIVSKLGRNFPTRPAAPPMFPLKVDAVGVGSKDEKPFSPMRGANFLRRPQ